MSSAFIFGLLGGDILRVTLTRFVKKKKRDE